MLIVEYISEITFMSVVYIEDILILYLNKSRIHVFMFLLLEYL